MSPNSQPRAFRSSFPLLTLNARARTSAQRCLRMSTNTHDTTHSICPIKANDNAAHLRWYADEAVRWAGVNEALNNRLKFAPPNYAHLLVASALRALPPDIVLPVKALAHVVKTALTQFSVEAGKPDDLLFAARNRYWGSLLERTFDSKKRIKLALSFSLCPEGDTSVQFERKYNGEPCKHHGEFLHTPEPNSLPPQHG